MRSKDAYHRGLLKMRRNVYMGGELVDKVEIWRFSPARRHRLQSAFTDLSAGLLMRREKS